MRPVYLSICSSDYSIVWDAYCENAFVAFKTAVRWLREFRRQHRGKIFLVYHEFCCRAVFGTLKDKMVRLIWKSEEVQASKGEKPFELVVPFITRYGKELRFIRADISSWTLTDDPWERSYHPYSLPYEYLFRIIDSVNILPDPDGLMACHLEQEFVCLKREHASLRLEF